MDAMQQVINRLNELKQKLKNEMDITERNRLRESIAITKITRDRTAMYCDYIEYVKENIVDKIEKDEWDIKHLEELHFVRLIDIFLNQHESNTLQRSSLHSLSTIFEFTKINAESLISTQPSLERIFLYSRLFEEKISKLFKQLKNVILSDNTNIEILILSISVLQHLHFVIEHEYIDTKLRPHDLPLLSNLCNLSSHIDVLQAASSLLIIFIDYFDANPDFVDDIIGNLNLLIIYDDENILEHVIASYHMLFTVDPYIAPTLREYILNKKQFEEESEAKSNEDESLITIFVNNCHRKWKSELPPISLISLILKYYSPIYRKNIKRKTLDPIQRFVELILHPSQRVNTSVINLLYEIIVIGPVYIYMFDVNEMIINLMHYMKQSEKAMVKAFNLMMCCISFGDENIIKELHDIHVFVECIEKTLNYDQIDMEHFVFSGIEKLLTYYKKNKLAMNIIWNSLHKIEQQKEIHENNVEFINQIKHMMS